MNCCNETEILTQFEPLINSQVYSFKPRNIQDTEDLRQIANIGLIKAIRTWKKNESKFITYATVCIKNELRQGLLKAQRQKDIPYDIVNTKPVYGYNNVSDILMSLTDEEQKITELRYAGYTLVQIGEYFGRCKNWANRRTQIIKKKIKKYYVE